ncbi:hypothetical protein ACH4S8_26735 [Streptomyces sp. NPDC021080]|uniref:hypothetical protein n=1 Tax=Streptomyces sp. NPDC021080 TaxID=3365110 RepID=UPI0037A6D0A5
MRCSVTALFAAAGLALAGCSGLGGDSGPGGPVAGAKPSAASAARDHQACVDAWVGVMSADDYDPGDSVDSRPGECDGLPDQLKMFSEAELERATRDRKSVDDCVADPSCESWPLTSP